MELDFLKVIEIYELALYTWESGESKKLCVLLLYLLNEQNQNYIKRIWMPILPDLTRYNKNYYFINTSCSSQKVSYWAATEILSLEDEKARALLIEKFIDMAKVIQINILVS